MGPKRLKRDTPAYFDYKDVKTLQRFVNMYGQIEANRQDRPQCKATAPTRCRY